jgi:hypothetical protein
MLKRVNLSQIRSGCPPRRDLSIASKQCIQCSDSSTSFQKRACLRACMDTCIYFAESLSLILPRFPSCRCRGCFLSLSCLLLNYPECKGEINRRVSSCSLCRLLLHRLSLIHTIILHSFLFQSLYYTTHSFIPTTTHTLH